MILLDFLVNILPAKMFIDIVISAFIAILFLQSGLDKVFDWKGNLEWLNSHFSKTFLKDFVTPMLATITVLEVLAGIMAFLGIFEILFYKASQFALLGAELSALVLTMLFFGQRIAKEYAGAANLVPYFILSVVGVLLFV